MYTNAVIENEIWGSLKTNFKVYIDDIFATIPKMVFTHYNFYLDKVHITTEREREREGGKDGGREGRGIVYTNNLSKTLNI